MEEEQNPTGSEASELLADWEADFPEALDTPEGLGAALVAPQSRVPPGGTVAGWLASVYLHGDSEFKEHFRDSLTTLLEHPKERGLRGEALARAFALVQETRISAAVDRVRSMVESRELYALSDDSYGDLHGRALRSLLVLGDLDPATSFKRELKYRDYVPLVFAFVRDRAKDQLPEILPLFATFDFFADALHTVILTYPDDYMEVLRKAAWRTVNSRDKERTMAFGVAAEQLPIRPTELDELRRDLLQEEPPIVEVLVAMNDSSFNHKLIAALQSARFDAKPLPSEQRQPLQYTWIVTSLPNFWSHFDTPPDQSVKTLEVFDQGDPQGSHSKWSIVVPRRVSTPEGKVEHILQQTVKMRQQLCIYERVKVERPGQKPFDRGPRVPSPRGFQQEELDRFFNTSSTSGKKELEVVGAAPTSR